MNPWVDSMSTFEQYANKEWEGVGESSLCIYRFRSGHPSGNKHPYDPDDWCRCLQVLRLLCGEDTEAQKRLLQRMGEHYNSKHWLALAQHYDELMTIFKSEWKTGHAPKTYHFMQEIYKEEVSM